MSTRSRRFVRRSRRSSILSVFTDGDFLAMLVEMAYSIRFPHFVKTANAFVSDSFEHLAEVALYSSAQPACFPVGCRFAWVTCTAAGSRPPS
jgi:hypothetical protein